MDAEDGPIFRWYAEDFGGSDRAIGIYLAPYYTGPERDLLLSGRFRIDHTHYDWTLNRQADEERPGG